MPGCNIPYISTTGCKKAIVIDKLQTAFGAPGDWLMKDATIHFLYSTKDGQTFDSDRARSEGEVVCLEYEYATIQIG